MGDMALSSDEQWLAWTEDTQGEERFTLWLKALPNGAPVQLLSDIGAGLCWAEDQTDNTATLLFTRFDDTQRPDSVWRLSLSLMEPDASHAPVLVLREEILSFGSVLAKRARGRGCYSKVAQKTPVKFTCSPPTRQMQCRRVSSRANRGLSTALITDQAVFIVCITRLALTSNSIFCRKTSLASPH
ncbi:hypothetical protein HORIV_43670 [Vreelandella olivaria]|uniref:Uncharacterized protein n=1 Tax=Vreelandella olivaria TaxID=390919 RepID=A0ABM7GMD6_9GAMM|nr:hypothetical protein HORIV_43670 [Halomonas olivaria]